MHSTLFQIDDEHRARIIDCLRKEGIQLAPEDETILFRNIDHSIQTFLTERCQSKATFRKVHEALCAIWKLAHDDDCPVGQLRARISQLPQEAVDYMDRRARHVIPNLLPGQDVEGGFLSWAARASPEDLIRAAGVLSAEGGQPVSRSRGPGVRSPAKLEPRVLGQVRGASDGSHSGGRPKHASPQDLICWLATDWIKATGKQPSPGRSDRGGFGDLVHSVFQWLGESAPDQALRRYWGEVERGRIQTAKKESERTGS
jgi:hypothetical protein